MARVQATYNNHSRLAQRLEASWTGTILLQPRGQIGILTWRTVMAVTGIMGREMDAMADQDVAERRYLMQRSGGTLAIGR